MKIQNESRGALWSSLASMLSLAATLSCCLPLGTLLMAAGSAGASVLSERLRPYLLWFSVAMLGLAFVQTYRGSKCRFRQRALRTIVMWTAAALVGGMLLFPQFMAGLMTGRMVTANANIALHTFEIASYQRMFEDAADQTRIVVLLSPT